MGIAEIIGRSAASAYASESLKSVYSDEWPSFGPTAGLALSPVPVFVFVSAAGKLFFLPARWMMMISTG